MAVPVDIAPEDPRELQPDPLDVADGYVRAVAKPAS